MALNFKISNSLEGLSAELAKDIKVGHAVKSVFQADCIVTQTVGMNNWIKIHLSNDLYILGNVQFFQPTDILVHVYKALGGKGGKVLDKEFMTWRIFSSLNQAEFTDAYPAIAAYYYNDPRKRMALAERTADLFDQYQIYRPNFIKAWNKKQLVTHFQEEQWQSYLWQALQTSGSNRVYDRLFLSDFIIEEIRNPQQKEKLKATLPTLHFFGLSILTPFHIYLFQVLSDCIDIYFYVLNPAPETYWMDDLTQKQIERSKLKPNNPAEGAPVGNTLLLNFGKVIKDTFRLFFENEQYLNTYQEVGLLSPQDSPPTLLTKIQADIYHNLPQAEAHAITSDDLKDGSIVINSCYTPTREVEVLYNFLVHQVENGLLKSVQDCLIMVSDIDAYLPSIKAVFDNAPYRFPYTIADHSLATGDTVLKAIHELLQFDGERFLAEDVLQLLEFKSIASKFGITQPELIRKTLMQANCLFGWEGRKADETHLLGFEYAIKRLVLDYCIRGKNDEVLKVGADEDFYPVDILEGAEGLEIIRFAHFVEVLSTTVQGRTTNQSLNQWLIDFHLMVENFISQEEEAAEEDLLHLTKQLDHIQDLTDIEGENLSYEVFTQIITPYVVGEQRSSNFMAGGLTFCSLIPMRSVPFKIVAMLGLNFDTYPRHEKPLGFDLMQKAPLLGDRNIKDNDKHLFLETILAARQTLYISYVGTSSKDNSAYPPSSLVEELIEYTGLKPQVHPLHNYSPRYNNSRYEGLYAYELTKAAQLPIKKQVESNIPLPLEIPVQHFLQFFDQPFKYYFNKVLGIYYNEDQHALPPSEPFDLDHLQAWSIKNEMLTIDDESTRENLRQQQVRRGNLPLQNLGRLVLETTDQEIAPLRKLIYQYRKSGEVPDALPVQLSSAQLPILVDHIFSGNIEHCYSHWHLVISTSKDDYKYLVKAYLEALLLNASGHTIPTVFISLVKNKAFELPLFSSVEACTKLNWFLSEFLSHSQALWPFSPKLLPPHEIKVEPALLNPEINQAFEGETIKKASDKINRKFNGDYSSVYDPYLLKLNELNYWQNTAVLSSLIKNSVQIHQQISAAYPSYPFSK